jgi:hypothetical protein
MQNWSQAGTIGISSATSPVDRDEVRAVHGRASGRPKPNKEALIAPTLPIDRVFTGPKGHVVLDGGYPTTARLIMASGRRGVLSRT